VADYVVEVLQGPTASVESGQGTTVVEVGVGTPGPPGPPGTFGDLRIWAKSPDLLVVGNLAYVNGLLVTADVLWPDGKTGVMTILARQGGTNAVTSYKITHIDGAVTTTYTQPAITRDSDGNATVVPAIGVA